MDMSISRVSQAYGVYQTDRTTSKGKTGKTAESKDMIALSSQAKDFQSVMKALANTPDIREDKVAAIKSRMDTGQYDVSAADIASRLVDRAVF